jgi:hypothetical protein
MSAAKMLFGLTEKGMRLQQDMFAAFSEFVTDTDAPPEEMLLEKAHVDAMKKRFDVLWKTAGVKQTVLLDSILSELYDTPKTLLDVLHNLRNHEEFDEFRNLDQKTFIDSAWSLIHAGLITGDENKMWVME